MRYIADGANYIKAFKRRSLHEDMRKLVNTLEEWENIVGDF
jgi:hypothetical protein